ncbi:MAG: STAS domain-containing protein [Verrucomicrobia bacterium]|nr:STAS domain-containing protein [Verrucomicrobiota bacterium]
MTIGVRTADKVTVVDIGGEVDLYHSPELLAKLTELIKQKHMSILLNFQAVTYIDSSGLASLIGAFQQLRPHGGQLRLTSLSKPVQSVFTVARLDKVFTIHPTEAEALQALGAS